MSRRLLVVVLCLALLVAAAGVVAAVLGGQEDGAGHGAVQDPSTPDTSAPAAPATSRPELETERWAAAESRPVEDSYYPDQGDPGIDTLHYGLDLSWDPDTAILSGKADIALRATADADQLRLDFSEALEVDHVAVDGSPVDYEQSDDDLVIQQRLDAEDAYLVEISYAGTPESVPAPTERTDFTETGMVITPDNELWTMQEPFGAFTWYPVNDQPSDKAFYDFTVRTPRGWAGIANGELRSRRVVDGQNVFRWHLSHPASSYLTTLAVGDYVQTLDRSPSGVPLSYWTHRGDERALRALRRTPGIMAWNERRLGPYPFDTLGIVVVDSASGMETQTMITLGNTEYTRSPAVIEHELTHQWYGDVVSPTDWRDVWMNEGMAMFVQGVFEADREGTSIDRKMDSWAQYEEQVRRDAGPPGAYAHDQFGAGNIYYGPALMWNELRHRIGDRRFWALVREWPTVHADGNATREQYYEWLERKTGLELSDFFDAWIMGAQTPERS